MQGSHRLECRRDEKYGGRRRGRELGHERRATKTKQEEEDCVKSA